MPPTTTASTPTAPPLPVHGLAATAAALADRTTTSRALLDVHLERIAALDGQLNAFRVVRADEARAEADAADARLAAGERLPLLGVPVAIKDDTDVSGQTIPFGTGGIHRTATQDADLVFRIGELDGRSYWPTGTAIEAACPFAFPWNVVGWPGISVPAGTDSAGVPIGAQLLGRTDDEEQLITLAAELERTADGPAWPALAGMAA